jgi:galactose oxidase
MPSTWVSSVLLFVTICGRVADARVRPFVPAPSAVLEAEGIIQPPTFQALAQPIAASPLDRTGWGVTTDSAQGSLVGANALDGDPTTMWHTEWDPVNVALPHTITLDMGSIQYVDGVTYLPRQDGNSNGNIGEHQLFISTDGSQYTLVAFGTWLDDASEKSADFETIPARFIKLVALTEAGNRGPWTSAAEINVWVSKKTSHPETGGLQRPIAHRVT